MYERLSPGAAAAFTVVLSLVLWAVIAFALWALLG
jgi:cbb3-type cytochrome oxidase subunit 3